MLKDEPQEVVILPHAKRLRFRAHLRKEIVVCRLAERARLRAFDLLYQIATALIQCLQAQLPAMQLDGELIDVAGDLGALRLVFFQLPACFWIWAVCIVGGACAFSGSFRDTGWQTAPLTRKTKSGRGRIDHQGGGAMAARESNVLRF